MIEAKSIKCGYCVYHNSCTKKKNGACEDYTYDKRLMKPDLMKWIEKEESD